MIEGVKVIKQAIETMPQSNGVYRMIDKNNEILYIGKAKNLPKRVVSYTKIDKLPKRLQRMVVATVKMEYTLTNSESEALLLEANLIKTYKPKFNILLRDDKSFPYICINLEHKFPRIYKIRKKTEKNALYFGPFATSRYVDHIIHELQKIFLIRPCADSYFNSRQRPCLEYQIKRCSGPCANKINQEDYKQNVKDVIDFLSGKSNDLRSRFSKLMEEASNNFEYEKAAFYRDRIKAINAVQSKQLINLNMMRDCDVIGIAHNNYQYCIQIFFFRGGQHYGNKAFFPIHTEDATQEEVIDSFIGQFYQRNSPPKEIVLPFNIENLEIIEIALKQLHKQATKIIIPKKGEKTDLIKMANENAEQALVQKQKESSKNVVGLKSVQTLFKMPKDIYRVEVYDNSHIFGEYAIGGMVVADREGFNKSEYKKYNLRPPENKGDDYWMLKEVLTRRIRRLLEEYPEYTEGKWPDLMLIDGGAGHLTAANEIIVEKFKLNVDFVCIAKGKDRNAGREFFHKNGITPFTLEKRDPVMKYLQILRDEVHRFAIESYRKRHINSLSKSSLEDIEGIGDNRKKILLSHFGSVQNIKDAAISDLLKVKGISKNLAEIIYNYFHPQS